MISSRSIAIARAGCRLFASDPAPLIATVVMPLALMAFVVPAVQAQLHGQGYTDASGAEQLVPGMSAMFAFFSVSLVGTLFYREHFWGTWDRLRASPATTADIILGKVAPLYLVQLLQMAAIFALGTLFFDYRITGSVVALVVTGLLFVAMVVAFSVMMVSLFTTMDQAVVLGNMSGMIMSGIGGSLTSPDTLPVWMQAIAQWTPVYYHLEAMRAITLDGAGLAEVAPRLLVVALFTVGFAVVAGFRFRVADSKIGTT
ncbi:MULTISPECIES: ABC transporter permease [unclassified Nocardiopsis]|uniref:ABC transporter permease n=1 Tax=Nocardiopsis TaxID=2013 RepID=UPI00387B1429